MSDSRERNDGLIAEKVFDFSGGELCLDFANTEADKHLPTLREDLETYGDLIEWARQGGALSDEEAAALGLEARAHPDAAEAALGSARHLRGAVYSGFSSLAARGSIEEAQLDALNDALAPLLARSRLVPRDGAFAWEWAGAPDALERPLWEVARSTADLLTSPDRPMVRECASPTCTWLFVDTSRNHSRRWCDMKVCGNRAKARRHYERHKGD